MATFIMFGQHSCGWGFWLSSHNLCALGSRQTLAIIIPQFSVCYGIKIIF